MPGSSEKTKEWKKKNPLRAKEHSRVYNEKLRQRQRLAKPKPCLECGLKARKLTGRYCLDCAWEVGVRKKKISDKNWQERQRKLK